MTDFTITIDEMVIAIVDNAGNILFSMETEPVKEMFIASDDITVDFEEFYQDHVLEKYGEYLTVMRGKTDTNKK